MKVDAHRYLFMENDVYIKAEEHTLIALAAALRESQVEGTLSDLAYQIEYFFDVDGVRDLDDEDEEYVPSAENGDYSPSNPWDAPGMSAKDFI